MHCAELSRHDNKQKRHFYAFTKQTKGKVINNVQLSHGLQTVTSAKKKETNGHIRSTSMLGLNSREPVMNRAWEKNILEKGGKQIKTLNKNLTIGKCSQRTKQEGECNERNLKRYMGQVT